MLQLAPFVSAAGDMFRKMNKGGKNWGSSGASKGQGYMTTSKGSWAASNTKGGSGWDAHKGGGGWDASGRALLGRGKGKVCGSRPRGREAPIARPNHAQTREYVPRLQGRFAFSKAIKTVDTKTTLASEHPEVVLVRKGG